jgi:hypothetical protein
MNKYGWLAVTLVGTAISIYGNRKVQQEVKKEQAEKLDKMFVNWSLYC